MEWINILFFFLGVSSTLIFGNRLTDFIAAKVTRTPDKITSIRLNNLETKLDRVIKQVSSYSWGDGSRVDEALWKANKLEETFKSFQDHINKQVFNK